MVSKMSRQAVFPDKGYISKEALSLTFLKLHFYKLGHFPVQSAKKYKLYGKQVDILHPI